MKKKIILFLIITNIVFCIPTPRTQSMPFDVADPVGDVRLVKYDGTNVSITYPALDIVEINKTSTHLILELHTTAVIDDFHQYSVIVYWDSSGENYTKCIAGDVSGTCYINGTSMPYYNGSYTVFRNLSGDIIYSELNYNLSFTIGSTISFPVDFACCPIMSVDNPYSVMAEASAPYNVYSYTAKYHGSSCEVMYDAAGSEHSWIAFPDECGIETPIILSILGSSFILMIVLRRRKLF